MSLSTGERSGDQVLRGVCCWAPIIWSTIIILLHVSWEHDTNHTCCFDRPPQRSQSIGHVAEYERLPRPTDADLLARNTRQDLQTTESWLVCIPLTFFAFFTVSGTTTHWCSMHSKTGKEKESEKSDCWAWYCRYV